MGFSDTAAFFESKAEKDRSPNRRQDFVDAASFYRALAQITPTFPYGYKAPAASKPNGSKAERLLSRAEQCRAIAAAMSDPSCKAKLERLAQTYERATRCHE